MASYSLAKSASTEVVRNDREEDAVCAILFERDGTRILCSYFERWNIVRPKNPQFSFSKAGMTFFMAFQQGEEAATKQIFRLDWDDWRGTDKGDAAYPHWNFDQWLTASEPRVGLEELRSQLAPESAEERVFELGKRSPQRPSLAWFTRLHFPMIATCDPKVAEPHRSIPETTEQLEGWVESALSYLKRELSNFLVSVQMA